MMQVYCSYCSAKFDMATGAYNRSMKRSGNTYCSTKCSGKARRLNRTSDEKKAMKAAYDRRRRCELRDVLKAKRAEYYQRTKNPEREAAYRKSRMHLHVAYCQAPKYKEWKREYDRRYRAKKDYGEFAECFLLTQDIRSACLQRQSDYEIRLVAGTLNKSQKRKRDYGRANSNQPETGSMGNIG